MRRLERTNLSDELETYLGGRQQDVNMAASPRDEAERLWKSARRTKVFDQIEGMLVEMNGGQPRCMYCEHSEARHIDHFRPKSLFPEDAFQWSNYFLACEPCNSGAKGTAFPMSADGNELLLRPDKEHPRLHLELASRTGRYEAAPGSAKAQPSIDTFDLNRQLLTTGRSDAWRVVERLLRDYGEANGEGDRQQLLSELKRRPFLSVYEEMVLLFKQGRINALRESTVTVLRDYPQLYDWLSLPAE